MTLSLFNRNKEKQPNDVELVAGFRDGNRSAQQALFMKCRTQFMQSINSYHGIREEAKMDVFQEAYIILWEKIERGDLVVSLGKLMVKGEEGMRQCDNLMAFFMRIVRNKYYEQLRLAGREVPLPEKMERCELYSNIPMLDDDPQTRRQRIVDQCVKELPKHCVEILTLFYYELKSLDEILNERMQNSTKNGLKNSKSKCLGKLKSNIKLRMEMGEA